MVKSEVKDICFGTLALGQKYRSLALDLAADIQQYSPGTTFVVLTDKPSDFAHCSHVLAIKHQQQGVYPYHDKRFVIAEAIARFETCIFIDADMRILGQVPDEINWCSGITARSGSGIIKHNQEKKRDFEVIAKVAEKLELNLENVKFVHEFLFTVKSSAGREIEFLKHWDAIAAFFELNGVYLGEGNAIGLAAAKAELSVQFDSEDRFPFFKDRIEKIRISKGQADPTEKLAYFDRQKALEHPKLSKSEKRVLFVRRNLEKVYRLLRLRLTTLENFKFYYW
ncbi:hypothetical protein H6F88_29625 [Oculatella sp. FACHB-28]|uniref:hypothetical protein n=1 Tax=Oculatella sp. FACHB-28 TaxID=2692845 RepID=UPI0016881024|nr:hypothetical protein [Oculatella sp. FACHB-28]MBD1868563.1 hypothetical protein [Cyanobacteria bacterium FACHB-471]MBD2060105.1 hypothetical protein [Oculatella sp. FACHB-28]